MKINFNLLFTSGHLSAVGIKAKEALLEYSSAATLENYEVYLSRTTKAKNPEPHHQLPACNFTRVCIVKHQNLLSDSFQQSAILSKLFLVRKCRSLPHTACQTVFPIRAGFRLKFHTPPILRLQRSSHRKGLARRTNKEVTCSLKIAP